MTSANTSPRLAMTSVPATAGGHAIVLDTPNEELSDPMHAVVTPSMKLKGAPRAGREHTSCMCCIC